MSQVLADNGKGKITPAQRRAIAALLSERDVRSAALAANISERTLHRWLDDHTGFRQALSQAEGKAVDRAARKLLHYTDHAVSTMVSIMADQGNPAAVRLRAAIAVTDGMTKLRELNDLENRVSELEKKLTR